MIRATAHMFLIAVRDGHQDATEAEITAALRVTGDLGPLHSRAPLPPVWMPTQDDPDLARRFDITMPRTMARVRLGS